ncbi:hypothetical protein ACFWVP_23260 [Streptomyces sp. NPDC058637]|uniref:phosphoketolase family protein n=1 Tax=Streptomyces sp. NPDC058637 TaxID=3346569 RepID=UPI00365D0559
MRRGTRPAWRQAASTRNASATADSTRGTLDFHGCPPAVHQLLHGRPGPERFQVRGYVEEGTITTPYELLASDGVSRHDLAVTALGHLYGRASVTGDLATAHARHRDRLREEIRRTGTDPAEITEWTWQR